MGGRSGVGREGNIKEIQQMKHKTFLFTTKDRKNGPLASSVLCEIPFEDSRYSATNVGLFGLLRVVTRGRLTIFNH